MTLQEIKENPDIREEFLREYSLLSGKEACSNCDSKLSGYFEHYQKLIKMKNETQYELKPGRHWVKALNEYVTNDSLTDEKAQKMLSVSPSYEKCFIRMPAVAVVVKQEKTSETFDEILLSVDGIGKGFLKKIKALHSDKESLLNAIENEEPTGIDESFNQSIKEAFNA